MGGLQHGRGFGVRGGSVACGVCKRDLGTLPEIDIKANRDRYKDWKSSDLLQIAISSAEDMGDVRLEISNSGVGCCFWFRRTLTS